MHELPQTLNIRKKQSLPRRLRSFIRSKSFYRGLVIALGTLLCLLIFIITITPKRYNLTVGMVPTQTIAAIAMRLNYVRLLVNKDPDAASDELRQLEELARKTTREIRQMLFTLRPLILESQGLIAALEQLKNKLSENDPLQIHLDASYDVEASLSNEAKGSVFYIVEEATANVRKHAEATNVWIRLHRRGMTAIVEIEDDGKGFDVAGVEANYADRSSLGLLNLQERARLVGGKTVIRSAADQGTKVTVTIPISVEEAQSRSS